MNTPALAAGPVPGADAVRLGAEPAKERGGVREAAAVDERVGVELDGVRDEERRVPAHGRLASVRGSGSAAPARYDARVASVFLEQRAGQALVGISHVWPNASPNSANPQNSRFRRTRVW